MKGITIETFTDPGFGKKGQKWSGVYDPTKLDLSFTNRFLTSQAIGISGPPVYVGEDQKKMSFPLLFDNSWVASKADGEPKSIKSQVDDFVKLVHTVNSESHTANYLKITLGDFIFNGQSESLMVNYTLFSLEGEPLRAEVMLTILQTETIATKKAAAGLKSPDLTRSVVIKEGDSLAGISQKYYNTPHYYLELARVNQLPDFMILQPGTRLVIPPLES
jgi:LysM repeat protein